LVALLIPTMMLYSSSPYYNMVKFVEYHPPPQMPFEGVFAPNDKLKKTEYLAKGQVDAPESVTFDDEGNIYAGCADGYIYKIFPGNNTVEQYAAVGGRPLGLNFDKDKNLIVADSLKGLVSVHPVTRQVTILTGHAGGKPIFFADDVEVAKSGKIYFTDASTIGPVQNKDRWISLIPSVVAIIANEPQGRLIEYDPATRQTKVLLEGLVYANGVTLSKNEDFILIAETGRPSIHKYHISGPKAGTSEYVAKNLPGIPDGLNTAPDGRFYVSFYSLRSPVEYLHPYPFIKKVAIALFPFLPLVPKPVGFVGIMDENGNFVDSLMDLNGEVTHTITDCHEKDGKLYFGSLTVPWIGVYDLKHNK